MAVNVLGDHVGFYDYVVLKFKLKFVLGDNFENVSVALNVVDGVLLAVPFCAYHRGPKSLSGF